MPFTRCVHKDCRNKSFKTYNISLHIIPTGKQIVHSRCELNSCKPSEAVLLSAHSFKLRSSEVWMISINAHIFLSMNASKKRQTPMNS